MGSAPCCIAFVTSSYTTSKTAFSSRGETTGPEVAPGFYPAASAVALVDVASRGG
jgi:hypothetical protein